jgi:hypothetical protein
VSDKKAVPAWMFFLGGIAALGVSAGIFLVVVSGQNRHVLVQDDYYAAGLKLDEHRAAEAAFDSLGYGLSLDWEDGALLLKAAATGAAGAVAEHDGEARRRARLTSYDVVVQLRRPDDSSVDRDVALTLAADSPPLWVADAPALRRGRWSVRVLFQRDGAPVMEHAFNHYAP